MAILQLENSLFQLLKIRLVFPKYFCFIKQVHPQRFLFLRTGPLPLREKFFSRVQSCLSIFRLLILFYFFHFKCKVEINYLIFVLRLLPWILFLWVFLWTSSDGVSNAKVSVEDPNLLQLNNSFSHASHPGDNLFFSFCFFHLEQEWFVVRILCWSKRLLSFFYS